MVSDVVKGVTVSAAGAVWVEVGYVRSEAGSVFSMESVSDCKSEGGAGCEPRLPVLDGHAPERVVLPLGGCVGVWV